jgi:hypothetical protein
MQTLLIVLMIGCVLAAAVHIGRGMWSRSRSVERHQHALGTLATLTSPPDRAQRAHTGAGDHQAHVRVIGRSGDEAAGAGVTLPPPREVTLPGPSRPSPFRRPSHLEPSVAAMDAVATTARLSTRALPRLLRGRSPAAPPPDDATLPGIPPVRAEGPSTRPVPVIQPQVFYFDDVRPGPVPARNGAGVTTSAPGPVPAAALPDDPEGEGPKAAGARGRKSPVVRPLAVAAVAVAVAGVALGFELANPARRATLATPTTVSRPRPSPPAPSTTPPVRATTTAPATAARTSPPQPAVLVSANGGTATYDLTSPTASIVVKAHGPCWIEVKAGSPKGQVVVEETLSSGQLSSVSGPAWIRLGDPPHVAVTVDGTPMRVPGAGAAVPLNLQFTLG